MNKSSLKIISYSKEIRSSTKRKSYHFISNWWSKIKHTLRCINNHTDIRRESLILIWKPQLRQFDQKFLQCKLGLTGTHGSKPKRSKRSTRDRVPLAFSVEGSKARIIAESHSRRAYFSIDPLGEFIINESIGSAPARWDNRFRNCANTGASKNARTKRSIVRIVHSTRRFIADSRYAHTQPRAIGIPETRITLIDRLMNRSPRIEFLFSVENVA